MLRASLGRLAGSRRAGNGLTHLRTDVAGGPGTALFNSRGELVAVHAGPRVAAVPIEEIRARLGAACSAETGGRNPVAHTGDRNAVAETGGRNPVADTADRNAVAETGDGNPVADTGDGNAVVEARVCNPVAIGR
jgi:hypothetical protein